ncbi:hypothetical protein OPQ81_009053 [Rhizoctonia solani]|nr:hypothetical protein OPQ81_009053 [Rhizoctonia solani]
MRLGLLTGWCLNPKLQIIQVPHNSAESTHFQDKLTKDGPFMDASLRSQTYYLIFFRLRGSDGGSYFTLLCVTGITVACEPLPSQSGHSLSRLQLAQTSPEFEVTVVCTMFAAEKCCQDLWSSLLDPNDNMSTARKHENKALSSLLNEELNGSASSQAGLTDPYEGDQKGACGLPSYAPESPSFGELQDLNQAIDSYRRALSFSSNSAGSRAHVLHLLSVMHAARFDLLYELDDINSAIAFCEEAISLVSEDEKGPLPLIGNLGGFYMLRCSRFGSQEDIERAVENLSLVVALTPSSDPELPMRLDMLGHCHLRRFECLGQPEDVHLAVKYNSQAVDLTSDENPEIAKPLCNLGIALQARFEHLGVLEDIDRAIEVMTRALAHLHSDPLDMAMVLRNLGTSYMNTRAMQSLSSLAILSMSLNILALSEIPMQPDSSILATLSIYLQRSSVTLKPCPSLPMVIQEWPLNSPT